MSNGREPEILAQMRTLSWPAWRGLLDPKCTGDEFQAAMEAGLVTSHWGLHGIEAGWSTPKGTRLLAKLGELAAGLTSADADVLHAICAPERKTFVMNKALSLRLQRLEDAGLIEMGMVATPLGRAALLVLEHDQDGAE